MSSLTNIEKLGHNLPASGLAGVSQAAFGFGAGLLLAGYLNGKLRSKIAFGLLTLGSVFLLPVIAGIVARVVNNPNSARNVRKQLESIRRDPGLSGVEENLF